MRTPGRDSAGRGCGVAHLRLVRGLLFVAGMTARPRERLWTAGVCGLAADELIAVVLGVGGGGQSAQQVGRALLSHCGGLAGLSRASAQELTAVPGVGAAQAARLVAAFDLGRRALGEAASGASLGSAADVFTRLRPRLGGLTQEVFVVLALDVRNVVIGELEIARGCLTGVEVHPREVFRPLIRCGAAAAIAAHNHPSGDPMPSPEDIELTRRLRAAGDLVGIPLLDHVVVGASDYSSIGELLGP